MPRYAKGKRSYAISDRSGFKVRYRSLKTEWNNLRVEPSEYESDELADNSEDEKKLLSAERRALSKIRLRKQSRSSGQTRKFQQDCVGS